MCSGVLEDHVKNKAIAPFLVRLNDSCAISWRKELFAPVGVIKSFENYNQLPTIINDTSYGLANGIFSEDIKLAHSLGKASRSGTWHINQWGEDEVGIPFGGIRDSGMGKEKCFYTFHQTIFEKSVVEEAV